VCSETSAYKIQTPGNYPEESIQISEHGEKSFEIKKISLNFPITIQKNKHQTMYAHNVTLRRVRVTSVAVEEQAVLHIRSVFVVLVIKHA